MNNYTISWFKGDGDLACLEWIAGGGHQKEAVENKSKDVCLLLPI